MSVGCTLFRDVLLSFSNSLKNDAETMTRNWRARQNGNSVYMTGFFWICSMYLRFS